MHDRVTKFTGRSKTLLTRHEIKTAATQAEKVKRRVIVLQHDGGGDSGSVVGGYSSGFL
jgi:hypothetical protein